MSCPDKPPASLRLQGVSWGPVRSGNVLHDISLDLSPGRILVVVGPNGAGKSTLLRLIYRFLKPTTGRVLLDDEDIHACSARHVARQVAAVLQEQPTDFALTVREIVALGRAPHRSLLASDSRRDAHMVDHALGRLALRPLANRLFGTLSGGERQRVMVARALAQEPRLIVLDEPTNHLDIRYQLELLQLIRELRITVVCSLHDLNLAAMTADDLLILRDGHPLAFGAAEQVLTPELIAQAFEVRARPIQGSTQFDFSLNDLSMESYS